MEINETYICECNNKQYNSLHSLRIHKKTKGHQNWEREREIKLLKVVLTERDNEIVKLKNRMRLLKELNDTLIARIKLDEL